MVCTNNKTASGSRGRGLPQVWCLLFGHGQDADGAEGFVEAPVTPGWGEPFCLQLGKLVLSWPDQTPRRLHYCWRGEGLCFPKQSTAMFPVI